MKRSATPALAKAPELSFPRSDWDVLFLAVCERLRRTVAPDRPPDGELAQEVRDSVLDCVAALEQLHLSLPGPRDGV